MNTSPMSYYLNFEGFSMEVRIDKQSSIDFSKRFSHHGPDFVFAVVELRLHYQGAMHLISSAAYPENFLERLRDWRRIAASPRSLPDVENIITCGGWGLWMKEYWNRIERGLCTIEDENSYDLLAPFSIIDTKEGGIAIYTYNSNNIFEVTPPKNKIDTTSVWAKFNSDVLCNQIQLLIDRISLNIKGLLN